MTPHTNRRGGSLIIDIVLPAPVGRISRASGTKDASRHARLVAMLRDLWDEGRADILRQIKAGTYTPAQVYQWRKSGQPLPSAEALVPLADAWDRWVRRAAVGEEHRDQMRRTRLRLDEVATATLGARVATVGDLLPLLTALRDQRHAHGQARAWAYDRSNAQAFVRDTLGRDHPLYRSVGALRRLTRTVARPRRPVTVAEMDRVAAALLTPPAVPPANLTPEEAHARRVETVGLVWTLALTGMGPKELYGTWTVEASHVHIAGTKRAARVRDVPRVRLPSDYTRPQAITATALEQRWTAVTAATIGRRTLYDLRRTFAVWCEAAGIPHSHIVRYMGHAAPTMTTLYQSRELRHELTEDAARLLRYLAAERQARPLALVVNATAGPTAPMQPTPPDDAPTIRGLVP